MIIKRLYLVASFYCLLMQGVLAADDKGQFAVRTMGAHSCAHYLSVKKTDTAKLAAYLGWVDGYLSATNQYTKKTYDIVPWGNTAYIAMLLKSYCTKHKTEPFYMAVNKLAGTFLKNRIARKSELIEVVEGQRKVYIYANILIKLKAELKKKALYDGRVDAVYDSALKQAVINYQKANKLRQTKLPDPVFLHHVFYQ